MTEKNTAPRLIKKYQNRRLYDTTASSYITLSQVKSLILAHEDITVIDAKSGSDITRSILLQIILEEESAGEPLFNSDMLQSLIRFYGHAMQGPMGEYLEHHLGYLNDFQQQIAGQGINAYSPQQAQEAWETMRRIQPAFVRELMDTNLRQSKAFMEQMQSFWTAPFRPARRNDDSDEGSHE
ncbi:polyhydroxyalkanoate synthesis repressor PhaR [Larsenimonas rhizosphaerae]|uniref:Polyhydroxyalkanoate synthesis repressor PhaR n=1 Tax=Larsenimonas rhizosphaerae TaxID=2944682 RepID=A0AA41ZFR1_9GAMM|nr:polyhydroxyalkanoate synthesis repressor PhaR [Larsenimonas rhizosphaerae]MCM2131015.1 polyhydroxyalkanoate synthesis repressor PhaR [Larsenimonas rhizosphaerae]MCX2523720.1 polyhydroxyalkanoate synthesis repressor PhaR [Larsenimonas rhizosphaerae]